MTCIRSGFGALAILAIALFLVPAPVGAATKTHDNLVGFKNVAFTAHDMKRHRILQRQIQAA